MSSEASACSARPLPGVGQSRGCAPAVTGRLWPPAPTWTCWECQTSAGSGRALGSRGPASGAGAGVTQRRPCASPPAPFSRLPRAHLARRGRGRLGVGVGGHCPSPGLPRPRSATCRNLPSPAAPRRAPGRRPARPGAEPRSPLSWRFSAPSPEGRCASSGCTWPEFSLWCVPAAPRQLFRDGWLPNWTSDSLRPVTPLKQKGFKQKAPPLSAALTGQAVKLSIGIPPDCRMGGLWSLEICQHSCHSGPQNDAFHPCVFSLG